MDTQEFQNYQEELAAAFLVEDRNLVLNDGPIERTYLEERAKGNKRFYIYLLAGLGFTTFTDLKIFKIRYGPGYTLPRLINLTIMSFTCVYTAHILSLGSQIKYLALDLGLKYEQQLLALNPELELNRPKFLRELEEYKSELPGSGPSTVYNIAGYFDSFTTLMVCMNHGAGYIKYKDSQNAKIYSI